MEVGTMSYEVVTQIETRRINRVKLSSHFIIQVFPVCVPTI